MIARGLTAVLVGVLLGAEPASDKENLATLGQALQKIVATAVPREIEDRNDWGKTVPIEPGLKFMALRTTVRVDDHLELPNGTWRRSKGTIVAPDKDIQIRVRDLKKLDGDKQRLVMEVDIRFTWEHEQKLWTKGIQYAGIIVAGKALSRTEVTCDFATKINGNIFPPTFEVDLKIQQTKTDLREFEMTKLTNIAVISAAAQKYGDEIKPLLQVMLSRKEKELTPSLNAALAEALKKK